MFSGRFPNEVAGMILVDSPQEDQYDLLPIAWKQFGVALLDRWEDQAKWMPPQIALGIARLRFRKMLGPEAYLVLQAKYLKTRASELKEIQISAEEARASGTLGSKPLIVLTAVQQDQALRTALTPQDFAKFQEIWVLTLQPRLVGLSTSGKQIVLSDAGHDIPTERPDAIVSAVHEEYIATVQQAPAK